MAILIAAGFVALCLPFSGALRPASARLPLRAADSQPHNSQPQNSSPHSSAPRPQPQPQNSRPQGGGPQNQLRPGQQYPPYRPQTGPTLSAAVGFSVSQQPRWATAVSDSAAGNARKLSERSCSLPWPGLSPSRARLPTSWKLEQHATWLRTAWQWPAQLCATAFFAATPGAAGICSSRPPGRMA